MLSKLDLSQDILNESIYPKVHFTSPGCAFKQTGQALEIYNNSETIQQSYINLGRLYNYAAIDMDIRGQNHSSYTANALLSLYKDKGNRFVITQRDIDAGNKQIILEIFKNGSLVLSSTLSEKGITTPNTLRVHLTGKYLNVLNVKNEAWEILGSFDISEHPVGKNIWPAIIPVTRNSGTYYYLLTFDRDSWTGPRTYGNIHWYYAEEFAEGFLEYEENRN